ncbi:MAG TPA: hypothetical protein VK210_17350, partial [Terriglobia bacterium]|nr:hypothetical protein [Terriglobia bacterium]
MSAILNTVLLDAVIKPSIVLTLTLGIARLLRRQSASLRHLVLTAGLASALALPFLGMIVPAWQPHVAGLAMDSPTGTALPSVPTSTIAASAAVPAAVPAAPLRV